MNATPKAGSVWKHTNGNLYHVLGVSNQLNPREDHPPDVIYCTMEVPVTSKYMQINFDKLWTRRLSDWHRSFTEDTEFKFG